MTSEKLTQTRGAWDLKRTEEYLVRTVFPLRLATLCSNGFPLVTSVWYLYDSGHIWCAVQDDSDVAGNIRKDNRCGFEVGPNHPPYMGVRGKGNAELVPARGREKLKKLINRFLGSENKGLAEWLLSRTESETAIRIKPEWFFTWDYSDRMK